MIGVPVIINHKDITTDNVNDARVGVVSNVWFNDKDGWYWCDGVIWDVTAQNLITDKGWSVSCSYDVKLADDAGGTENNIPYDIEFLDGVFTHLAIVDNPRYERANIVFNSKTIIENGGNGSGNFGHAGRPGEVGGSAPSGSSKGFVDLSDQFEKSPSLKEVKEYINDLVKKGARFATLNPDWFIDTKVNAKAKGHIIYSNEWQKMSNAERDRHNKYVIELKQLLENSEYLYAKDNTKKYVKPNIEKYHYFKTKVKIGEYEYDVIFDTEQYKGESEEKPQTVHLYNVHEINKTSVRAESQNSKNTIGSSNNNITDNQDDFNPGIKKNEVNNWNEEDHPRDENGRFTSGGSIKSFKEQIKDVEEGKVSDKTLLNVLDKPSQVWKDSGLPDKPLVMSAGVYKKATETKHQVDKETIEKLPKLIQDPLYIFKSSTQAGSFVGVLDAVENKEKSDGPLIVAIKPGQKGLEVNIITSTYGKDKDFIERELNKGNLLYENKKTGVSNRKASIALKVNNLSTNIIINPSTDFNPNVQNIKEHEEMALLALLEELKKLIAKVENSNDKGEDMDKKQRIMNILNSANVDEDVKKEVENELDKKDQKTAEKANEKEGYEPQDDKADNKKVKNEETKEDKNEYNNLKKDVKEDVQNKCKNSVENSKPDYFEHMNKIYNSAMVEPKELKTYVSQAERLEAGNKY